ncbi:MAG: D-alanyl-D-alanine carboxypeptidase [Oscillospiraceae bacterium]|nr:D-alanyl-D-alanine carboxypeptidase [Oscillospiraceae bacterium]
MFITKKRLIACVLLISLLCPGLNATASDAPSCSAACAILMDGETGEAIYEKHPDKIMLIASTTKIMTALVVLESCDISETVRIKREWTGIEGSSMYLKEGEELTVEELLYGLLLASGNDAAVALACHVSGSVEAFAEKMNEKARSLNLASTSFKNPHGLDAEGHHSTARDLGVITMAAMENETFAKIVSTTDAVVSGRALTNHNRLLREYEGVKGVKTGYTKSAGRILVSCAERDGLRFICVTISDPDDWNDHKNLYDWAFSSFRRVRAISSDEEIEIAVISGTSETVTVKAAEDYTLLLKNDDSLTYLYEAPKFVYAGVNMGDIAGSVTVFKNGERLKITPLIYSETVEADETIKLTPYEKLIRALFGDKIQVSLWRREYRN